MRVPKVALIHIPKTGGTALGHLIYAQTRADPTFYFSFFGLDASDGANRIVVEHLRADDARHTALLRNSHFQASRVIMGHFSADIETLLPGIALDLVAVLREPVDRFISNVHQYTVPDGSGWRFGEFRVPSPREQPDAYWSELYHILDFCRGEPIPGLLPHESLMLNNGMCHMVGGTPLHTFRPEVNLARVRHNAARIRFALFERFDESCDALMRDLGLPVRVNAETNPHGAGNPTRNMRHRPYYGASDRMLDLAQRLTRADAELYALVTAQLAARTAGDATPEHADDAPAAPGTAPGGVGVGAPRVDPDGGAEPPAYVARASRPTTLVTAVYDLQPDSPVGGRGRPLRYYLPSLASIAAMDAALVVYTPPGHVAQLTEYLASIGATATVIGRDLETAPRFAQVQEIRVRQAFHERPWRDRCHVLCHAKLAWLGEQAAANPFGSDHVYWMDAGLAYPGLFPRRYLPDYFADRCSLFTPAVLTALRGPLTLVGMQPFTHPRLHNIEVEHHRGLVGTSGRWPLEAHVIGGLFGGPLAAIAPLYTEYDEVLGAMLDADLLGTEENVLTVLYHRDPARARLLSFNTWYHEESDVRPPRPDEMSFYRLFEALAGVSAAPAGVAG